MASNPFDDAQIEAIRRIVEEYLESRLLDLEAHMLYLIDRHTREQIDKISDEVDGLKANVDNLKANVDNLKANVDGVKAEVGKVAEDLRRMRVDHAARFERLESRMDHLEAVQRELAGVVAELAAQQTEIVAGQERMNEAVGVLAEGQVKVIERFTGIFTELRSDMLAGFSRIDARFDSLN